MLQQKLQAGTHVPCEHVLQHCLKTRLVIAASLLKSAIEQKSFGNSKTGVCDSKHFQPLGLEGSQTVAIATCATSKRPEDVGILI